MLTILLTGLLQGSSTCWEDESIALVCLHKEKMIWDGQGYAAIWVKGFRECRQLCGNELGGHINNDTPQDVFKSF